MKILIFTGHGKSKTGGYDPGACYDGYEEFKLAKEIAKAAAEELKKYDCTVDFKNYDGSMYLTERISYEKSGNYDLCLEVHLNAGKGTGTECYYSRNDSLGKRLAAKMSKAVAASMGIADRGAKTKTTITGKDYFGIIRDTKSTALLLESCFIDSADVYKAVAAPDKAGQAAAKAIAAELGLKKKEKPKPEEYYIWTGKFNDKETAERYMQMITGLPQNPYCEIRKG